MRRFSGNQISIPHAAMLKLRQAGKLNLNWLRGTDLNRRPSGYEPDACTFLSVKTLRKLK